MNTPQKIMIAIWYFIVIFIFIHTYFYLDQLNNCECFNKNDKYAVDLEFMKWFQILEIFIFSIYVGFMIFINKNTKINRTKLNNSLTGTILASISLALLLAISLYMGINVVNLYMNIKDECKCANSYYKYFVYYEGVMSISTFLRFFSGIITIILILLFNYLGR